MSNSSEKLGSYFVGWQCRIRQQAMRNSAGRPSPGMQPRLNLQVSDGDYGPITTMLLRAEPTDWISEFRHNVRKTHDPASRRDAAVKLLSSVYYQYPAAMDDKLTASFALDSELAELLISQSNCALTYEQYNQAFRVFCTVAELLPESDPYQLTYWHNAMFNRTLPARIRVLQFCPDWSASSATPAVN